LKFREYCSKGVNFARTGNLRASKFRTVMSRLIYIFHCLILLVGQSVLAQEAEPESESESQREIIPNVIVILANDLGYHDYGVTGHPVFETPYFDSLASRSVRWDQFYVSPTGSPTRSSLLTGRHHFRTGVLNEQGAGSMMAADEVTLAEVLASSGYNTGAFGLWELGDHYPMRASDQGFQETLIYRGHSEAQASSVSCYDPILYQNNREVQLQGHCSDIYTEQMIRFMQSSVDHGVPFFCYLAFNSPDSSLATVKQDWLDHYQAQSMKDLLGEAADEDLAVAKEQISRIGAFVSHLDENVGKVMTSLAKLEQSENTIIVYVTDNGAGGHGYSGGLRGGAGSVYEGGVRSPLWISWPEEFQNGLQIKHDVAGHIDVMPTLLEACQVGSVEALELDGRSLLSTMKNPKSRLSSRSFITQLYRGASPLKYDHFMVRLGQWKLLSSSSDESSLSSAPPKFELYHLKEDPSESENLSETEKMKLNELLEEYHHWFEAAKLSGESRSRRPYILVNSKEENPVVLTQNDFSNEGRNKSERGYWKLDLQHGSRMDVSVKIIAPESVNSEVETCRFKARDASWEAKLSSNGQEIRFEAVSLARGKQNISVDFFDKQGKRVDVECLIRMVHR